MAIHSRDRFAQLPEARRKALLAEADRLVAEELTLAELREARRRSQAELARKLGVQQSAVSRIERRTDMYLSTLTGIVEAMGGTLEIIARFPDHIRPCASIRSGHRARRPEFGFGRPDGWPVPIPPNPVFLPGTPACGGR